MSVVLKHLLLENMYAYKENIYFNDEWVVCRKGCRFYTLRKNWAEPVCFGVCPEPAEGCHSCVDHSCFDLVIKPDSRFSQSVPSDTLPFVKKRLAVTAHPVLADRTYELRSIEYRAEDWPRSLGVFVEQHWWPFVRPERATAGY